MFKVYWQVKESLQKDPKWREFETIDKAIFFKQMLTESLGESSFVILPYIYSAEPGKNNVIQFKLKTDLK